MRLADAPRVDLPAVCWLRRTRVAQTLSVILAFAALVPVAWANNAKAGSSSEWNFIWVTSGEKWNVLEGTAVVTVKNGRLHADMRGNNSVVYELRGTISESGVVRAGLTNTESDAFVNSPLKGTYKKRFYKDISPCGDELFHLHDGYNFLGIKRSIREPEIGRAHV